MAMLSWVELRLALKRFLYFPLLLIPVFGMAD